MFSIVAFLTRQRANDASRDKPCFDDDLKVITSTHTSKHRNMINIYRKHQQKYIRTMSLQYTISLAKLRHLDGTPEGLDTRMASYLKHPWPWLLVLLLLHPLHWNIGLVLQVVNLAVTYLSLSTDSTYSQGAPQPAGTCVENISNSTSARPLKRFSPTNCRIWQTKTFRIFFPTYSHRIWQKTRNSLVARWKKVSQQICLTLKSLTPAEVGP